jgi:methionyl aminopeptidase
MSVTKNPEQVELMRRAGSLLSRCLDLLVIEARSGLSSLALDTMAEEFIRDHRATPVFKDYQPVSNIKPYPNSICFSKNSVVVHGIPSVDDIIHNGDVITIDCGLRLDGWCADAARLFGIGTVAKEDLDMIEASEKVLQAGIDACVTSNKLSDICYSIQQYAERSTPYYNVIEFCGHAIGEEMHESPQVPNFGVAGRGPNLEPGMVFCLEPMLKKTKTGLGVLPDQWTIATVDGSTSTHIEHMVLVTEGAPEILTL